MPFRRRNKLSFPLRLREAFWPRKGLLRGLRTLRLKVLRISGSPHSVATGLAVGVMMAWTPFLGFHVLLAIALAYLLRVNLIAAALGTAFANPLTFPLIWSLTWEIGQFLLGGDIGDGGQHTDLAAVFSHLELSQVWGPVLKPMVIGCIPPALISGLAIYLVTSLGIRSFRSRRLERLTARAVALRSQDDYQRGEPQAKEVL